MQTSRDVRWLDLMELRMFGVKVRGRETQKKNLPGRKVSQVKSFVGMLWCLPVA